LSSTDPEPGHRVIANLGRALVVAPLEPPAGGLEGAANGVENRSDDGPGGGVEQVMPLRNLPLIVAGDRVLVERDEAGAVRATRLGERATVLERSDHRGRFKPLAANLTHLGIVAADPPGIDTLLIDQFCVAAERAGLAPLIVINKTDLLDADGRAGVERLLADYRAAGYAAVSTDATGESGIASLRAALVGRAAALVGASGVGKSSIVQQLLPERARAIRVGAVSAATGLGSHTTSVTFWYDLPDGGSIVDSPGVRQYSVADLQPIDVRRGFREIQDAAAGCRFNDCTHSVEPGCAVLEALAEGRIADWRYANYRKLVGMPPTRFAPR